MKWLALVLLLVPSLAVAQRHHGHEDPSDAQARELFDQGSAAYEEGRYEEAISAFEEAYSLSARPLLLFNIANAQERLGRLSDALDNLRLYQEDAPAEERAVLERRIRQLEQRVQQQQADAQARDVQTHDIAEAAAEAAAARVAGHQPAERHGPAVDPLPYVALIGAGVFTITTIVFGALTLSARGDLSADGDATHPPVCMRTATATYCGAAADGAISNDGLFSILTDVSGVLALAAATAGLILLLTHHDPEAPPPATVGFAPHLGGAEVVLGGVL